MSNDILSSLAEARAVFNKHCSEQKQAGRNKHPDAWITLAEKTLVVVVHGYGANDDPAMVAYEYRLGFECAGIHEITKRTRNKTGNRKKKRAEKPARAGGRLRQLHMFKAG